jgi:hypothetical protein
MVLLAGMVPLPGERGDDWTANTGYPGPTVDGDEVAIFYHDVRPNIAADALAHSRRQTDAVGRDPWPLDSWPDGPTRYLLCPNDRMLPAVWIRRVVRERLGFEPDEIESGHCPALSRPRELAVRLVGFRMALGVR